jgi:hypothetical protein
MTAWVGYTSSIDAMKAIISTPGLRKVFGQLARMPYNRDDPDRTVCWLFPGSKRKGTMDGWPAYHRGKYMIDKVRGEAALRFGLHIEKGLGKKEAQQYGGRAVRYELDKEWTWHLLVQDLQNGKLQAALDRVGKNAPNGLMVEIVAGNPLDEQRLRNPSEFYGFEYGSGGILGYVGSDAKKNRKLQQLEAVGFAAHRN